MQETHAGSLVLSPVYELTQHLKVQQHAGSVPAQGAHHHQPIRASAPQAFTGTGYVGILPGTHQTSDSQKESRWSAQTTFCMV